MTRTQNFGDVIRHKLARDPELARRVEAAALGACVASQIYEARTAVGFTQKELADRAGTKQSVIARIEDADYDGHSLKLLQRVADALGYRLRVEFYRLPAFAAQSQPAPIAEESVAELQWPAADTRPQWSSQNFDMKVGELR